MELLTLLLGVCASSNPKAWACALMLSYVDGHLWKRLCHLPGPEEAGSYLWENQQSPRSSFWWNIRRGRWWAL